MSYDQNLCPDLLKGLGPFPTVRCKITQMSNKSLAAALSSQQGWHRDESPYEVLRVVVPLSSDNTYFFQLDNLAPEALIPGYVYAFDQRRYHRVFSNEPSELDRIHLVLSFVTWFDQTGDGWKPNSFHGRRHPLDLFDLIEL